MFSQHCNNNVEQLFSFLYLASEEELLSKIHTYYVASQLCVEFDKIKVDDAKMFDLMQQFTLTDTPATMQSILTIMKNVLSKYNSNPNFMQEYPHFISILGYIQKDIQSTGISQLVEKIQQAGKNFTKAFNSL